MCNFTFCFLHFPPLSLLCHSITPSILQCFYFPPCQCLASPLLLLLPFHPLSNNGIYKIISSKYIWHTFQLSLPYPSPLIISLFLSSFSSSSSFLPISHLGGLVMHNDEAVDDVDGKTSSQLQSTSVSLLELVVPGGG